MNYSGVLLMMTLALMVTGKKVLKENQIDVIMSLVRYLKIAFCIFETEENEKNFGLELTQLSKSEVLTGFFTFEEITKLMKESLDGRTMIVLKASNRTMEFLRSLSDTVSLSPAVWLLFSDSNLTMEMFAQVHIPFDCEFFYVEQHESVFSMKEVYRIVKTSPIEIHDLGNWTKKSGLVIEDKHLYTRRNSLKGHTLRGFIRNDPPYVLSKKNDKGDMHLGGYLFEVWSELEHRINFSSKFSEFINEENLEKSLKEGEADFALARIPTNPSTFGFVDVSQPVNEAKFYMFGHRPGSELDWDSYLKPFSPNTWLVNLFWMLSSSAALAILYRIAWDLGTSEREAKYFIFTFSESFLTVFRAICMQGSDITPRSNSCRLLFLSIYLTALVVTSAFSAALFSLLTVPKPRSPFSSLDEIVGNRRFKLGLPSDPAFHALVEDFSKTLHPTKQRALLRKLLDSKEEFASDPVEALQRLCTDKFYVFLFDLPSVLYLMQNMSRICQDKILPSGPALFTEHIGFGFKKKSPYKKLVDFHLIRMKNEGILSRLLLNYWPPQIPTVQATWVRVTLADISPILYMFAFGAFLGFVFLYAEKIVLHFGNKSSLPGDRNSSVRTINYSRNLWPNRFTRINGKMLVEF